MEYFAIARERERKRGDERPGMEFLKEKKERI